MLACTCARIRHGFKRLFSRESLPSLGPGEIRGGKRDVQYDSPFMLVARWKYLVACIYTVPGYLCNRGTGSHCKMHYFSITRIASVIPFDRYTHHRGPAVARTRENSTSFHRERGRRRRRGRGPVLKTVRGRSGRSLSKTVTLRDGQCKLRWRIHMCREAV